MALSPGDTLGRYEVVSLLGKGGMGEVYRAHDPQLNRDVAIKVLPGALANDSDYLARFQREAQTLASLNHPNIAAIYGLEGKAIVMELVEGDTLKGPLPLAEALAVAKQIAEALEAAHEKHIIHRDLKPGNIKVTPEGVVKVLDFGLAKALSERPTQTGPDSPTLTLRATEAGLILGTAGYMSPEQAAGKFLDRRTDIWSFGVVFYELLTGKRLFDGETVTHTLADVIRGVIDLSVIEDPQVRHLIGRCLDRNMKTRLAHIAEARIAMENYASTEIQPQSTAPAKTGWRPRAAGAFGLATLLGLAIGVGTGHLWRHSPDPEPRSSQFALAAPGGSTFVDVITSSAVSPDGRLLVFSARDSDAKNPVLWLRPIHSLNARSLSGTERADFPFWSPDSQSLAYFADGKLKRIAIAGGSTPATLCDATPPGPGGGSWNQDGLILFTGEDGLYRVPAAGGVATRVTQADPARHEMAHGFPQFLPNGRRFLYFIQSADQNVQGVYASVLERPQERSRLLATAHKALYTPPVGQYPGMLLWLREQVLLAQAFDVRGLKLDGEPAPLADTVSIGRSSMGPSAAAYWVSHDGVLAYRADSPSKRQLLWVGRDGKEIGEAAEEDEYTSVRLSPDGRKALVGRVDAVDRKNNLWLLDFSSGVMTKLTIDGKQSGFAVWSPDSRSIAYSAERNGVLQIFKRNAVSGAKEEQVTNGLDPSYVTGWSGDGSYLFCTRVQGNSHNIWALPLEGGGSAARKPFIAVPINAYGGSGAFSPDGKSMAHHSAVSGRVEVYVRPFAGGAPTATSVWQVSKDGGMSPRWRADGRELFYLSRDGVVSAATVRPAGSDIGFDAPQELFRLAGGRRVSSDRGFDVSSDGQRFLVVAAKETDAQVAVSAQGAATDSPLIVVLNWQAGLKK
jgi:serine/threonine protein kinase